MKDMDMETLIGFADSATDETWAPFLAKEQIGACRNRLFSFEKRRCVAYHKILLIKMINLPRQTQDKHSLGKLRETRCVLSAGAVFHWIKADGACYSADPSLYDNVQWVGGKPVVRGACRSIYI